MSQHILLDSAPLGLLSNPMRSPEVIAISDWMTDCLAAGHNLYIPEVIDYELRRATDLWAFSHNAGIPTGDPKKLDIDVILCAQALTLPVPASTLIVATTNVSHIARFVSADLWANIKP